MSLKRGFELATHNGVLGFEAVACIRILQRDFAIRGMPRPSNVAVVDAVAARAAIAAGQEPCELLWMASLVLAPLLPSSLIARNARAATQVDRFTPRGGEPAGGNEAERGRSDGSSVLEELGEQHGWAGYFEASEL